MHFQTSAGGSGRAADEWQTSVKGWQTFVARWRMAARERQRAADDSGRAVDEWQTPLAAGKAEILAVPLVL